jgi:hypothetical protein
MRNKVNGKKRENRFPTGWDEKKVRALARRYERQTEEEAVAEDEAAYRSTKETMMSVPVELVSKVQRLISRRAS